MDRNIANHSSQPGGPATPNRGQATTRSPLRPSREVDWDSLPDVFLPGGGSSQGQGATESPLARTQPIPIPLPERTRRPERLVPIAEPLPAAVPQPVPRPALKPAPLTPPPVVEALPKPAAVPAPQPTPRPLAQALPPAPKPVPVTAVRPPAVPNPAPLPRPEPIVSLRPASPPTPAPMPLPKPVPAAASDGVSIQRLPDRSRQSAPSLPGKREEKAARPARESGDAVNPIRAAICGNMPARVNPILASVIGSPLLDEDAESGPEHEAEESHGLWRLAAAGLVAAGLVVGAYAFYGNGFDQAGLDKTAATAEQMLRASTHRLQQGFDQTRAACRMLVALAIPPGNAIPPAAEAGAPAPEGLHLAGRLKSEIGSFVQNFTSRTTREDWSSAKASNP